MPVSHSKLAHSVQKARFAPCLDHSVGARESHRKRTHLTHSARRRLLLTDSLFAHVARSVTADSESGRFKTRPCEQKEKNLTDRGFLRRQDYVIVTKGEVQYDFSVTCVAVALRMEGRVELS